MIRAAVLMLAMAGAAQAEPVLIVNDYGGSVLDYQARRQALAGAGPVEIRGRCDSACTIFTTLPNACVGPGAVFGFHGARPKTGIPQIDLFLDMQLGRFYRAGVRRQFLEKWRFRIASNDLEMVSSARLRELDPKIRVCKPFRREKR